MYLVLDVQYGAASACGASVGFASADDAQPVFTVVEQFAQAPAEYEPGEFKKRELPFLLALVEASRTRSAAITAILVDGYVWLDDNRPGLGAHLYQALTGAIPVIGVAKTRYHGAAAIEILRGQSKAPLFVTSAGIEAKAAAALVAGMHGEHRIPTMLRLADAASRGRRA